MGKTNYLPNLHILASILPFFCLVMFHIWSLIQACTCIMRDDISYNGLQITVVMTLNYPNRILVEGCTHILIHCSKNVFALFPSRNAGVVLKKTPGIRSFRATTIIEN